MQYMLCKCKLTKVISANTISQKIIIVCDVVVVVVVVVVVLIVIADSSDSYRLLD